MVVRSRITGFWNPVQTLHKGDAERTAGKMLRDKQSENDNRRSQLKAAQAGGTRVKRPITLAALNLPEVGED